MTAFIKGYILGVLTMLFILSISYLALSFSHYKVVKDYIYRIRNGISIMPQ